MKGRIRRFAQLIRQSGCAASLRDITIWNRQMYAV